MKKTVVLPWIWSFHEKFNFGTIQGKFEKNFWIDPFLCTCYRGGGGVQKVPICLAERGAHEQKLACVHVYLLQKST